MVRTGAKSAAQERFISSAPHGQGIYVLKHRAIALLTIIGKRPQGILKHKNTRRTTTFQQGAAPERPESALLPSSPAKTTASRRVQHSSPCIHQDPDFLQQRPRPSPGLALARDSSPNPANHNEPTYEPIDPVRFWARRGHWPREYFEPDMEYFLARKRSPSLSRRGSTSATSTTPSDQRPRGEKSAPYRDPRYMILLETKGSFMEQSDLGITRESSATSHTLLSSHQTTPDSTLFQDDIFEETCRAVHYRNEARVFRDITPLIVPSAENLRIRGAKHMKILIESVNEGWNNSIPLLGTRPQPD